MSTRDSPSSPIRSLRRVTNRLRTHSSASDLQAAVPTVVLPRKMSVSDIDPSDLLELSVCNLPEMLAKDLDLCEAAFITKNMTAGAPLRNLALRDDFLFMDSTRLGSEDYLDPKDVMSRRLSLSAIESQLGLPDMDDNGDYSEETYLTSDSGSDSGIAEPPSVRMRKESVVTAATSVNTHRHSNTTSRCSSSLGQQQQQRCSLTAFIGGNLDHIDHLDTSWFDQGVTPDAGAEDSSDDSMFGDDYDAAATIPYTIPPRENVQVEPHNDSIPDATEVLTGENPQPRVSFAQEEQETTKPRDVPWIQPNPLSYVVVSTSEAAPESSNAVQPSESRDGEGTSYLRRLRQRRAAERQRLKDSGSAVLEINPLALNPALFTRGVPFHALPSNVVKVSAADEQRPNTAPGSVSSEKDKATNAPRTSTADKRASLRTLILRQNLNDEPGEGRPASRSSIHSLPPTTGLSPRPKSRIVRSLRSRLSRMSDPAVLNDEWSTVTADESREERQEAEIDNTINESGDEYKAISESRAETLGILSGESSVGGSGAKRVNEDVEQQREQTLATVDFLGHIPDVAPPIPARDPARSITPAPSQSTHTGLVGSTIRPGIPLSPEVIENLRVSVSGFPDTMLLTSSLSIETIRSYAKKLKHNTRPTDSSFHQPATSSHSRIVSQSPSTITTRPPTPSLWKRSLGGRSARHSACSTVTYSNSPLNPTSTLHRVTSSSSSSADTTPLWTCIKNIFPNGSDYRCEALYAHLVAYNYITTSCGSGSDVPTATTPQASASKRTMSLQKRNRSRPNMSPRTETDELYPVVPKKAAHLLGLGPSSHSSSASSSSHISRLSTSSPIGRMRGFLHRHKAKDSVAETEEELKEALGGKPAATRSNGHNNEMALREVQMGLVRCVAALVDLLGKSGPEDIRQEIELGEVPVVEPHLFRALCELVRAEEDMAV